LSNFSIILYTVAVFITDPSGIAWYSYLLPLQTQACGMGGAPMAPGTVLMQFTVTDWPASFHYTYVNKYRVCI
jgi:hypothetical protein